LRKTLDFSRAITSILDVDELFALLIQRFLLLMQAERGFLIVLEEGGSWRFRICKDFEGNDIERPEEQVSTAVIDEALRSGRTVLVSNAMSHPSFRERPSITRLELLSVVCAPLLGTRTGVLGAIYIDNRSTAGRFTEGERDMLALLANQAGIALENARLVEELKTAKAEAERAGKLEVVSQIGQRVNSVFRGVLARVIGNVQMLMWGDQAGAASPELKGIEEEARFGLTVLRKLEGISYSAQLQKLEPVNLRGLVESCLNDLPTKGARWTMDIEPALAVPGDRHLLKAAFREVIDNAWHAARDVEGGQIAVGAQTVGDWLDVQVKDNGPGMAKDTLTQAKEPFFTTKRGALGLGLSVADAVLYSHGGKLDIESRPKAGTTVHIRLPAGGETSPVAVAAGGPAKMTGKILIVDDEVEVADVLARALANQGNAVQVVPSTEEGMQALKRGVWDILIPDVGLPKPKLEKLVQAAHSADPRPTILLLTALGEWRDAAQVRGVDMTARKPVQLRLLPQLIRQALRNLEERKAQGVAVPPGASSPEQA
jgi:signal transduction histidine kinase/CheY-like chemotaxis protein